MNNCEWYRFWSQNSGVIGAIVRGVLIGFVISVFIVMKIKGYL